MKKGLIVIIVLIFVCFTANSQDRDPNLKYFNYLGSSRLLNANDSIFQFNRFHRGWHWADGKKMTEALKMTSGHTTDSIPTYQGSPVWMAIQASRFADSVDLIINLKDISANGLAMAPMNSMMMVFEPTLKIDTPVEFKTRSGDSTNPVFGFKYINPSISIQSTDRELKLNKTGGYGSPASPQIVLSEPWSKNELKYIPGFDGDDTTKAKYEGTEWYFTMKIRRNELLKTIDDSTVLSIKLPYSAFQKDITAQGNDTIIRTTGYIKFDSIPNDNYFSYYKEYDTTRGVYRATQPGGNVTEILIKRKHILKSTDTSITITAHFVCNFPDNQNNNFYVNHFHNDAPPFEYFIDSIGIELKYHGRLNIAVDFLKFETKNAQMLARGAFDSKISTSVQNALNIFSDTSYTNRGIKPKRFYTRDEGGMAFWGGTRYFNKLVGNLGTYEGSAIMTQFYNHYVNPPERWFCPWAFDALTPVPFIHSSAVGQGKWQFLGYKLPFSWYKDSLKSEWETFTHDTTQMRTFREMSFETYLEKIQKFDGVQNKIERTIYQYYANKENNNLLYSDLPWWSQYQILSEWRMNKIDNVWRLQLSNCRPFTGEEIRFGTTNAIIMGAKGLSYDGEYSNDLSVDLLRVLDDKPNATSLDRIMTRIGHGQNYYDTKVYNNLPSEEFLNLDDIGSDFLSFQGDSTNMNLFIDSAIVCDSLKIKGHRLYIGRKSIRKEMYKIHNWIKANEQELLNIKLFAWYGLGYRKFYNQDPKITQDTIMNKFIIFDSIRTKKLYQPMLIEGNIVQQSKENIDSSLFDIALHRPKNDSLLSGNQFYVGLQNRRLDPLIFYTDLSDTNKKYLKFLSTAEFDELCDKGGKDPEFLGDSLPPEHWQSYYYKRLGCREITIPFNYCDTTKPDEYVLLHVQELKADNAYDSTWSWWRKERYANYIDTVIGQNSTLAVKFLPGEGKMFKVDILRPEKFDGSLAHSNQSKLIVFPDAQDTSKVRYHTTYHKPDSNRSGVMSVFYRRSLPIGTKSNNKQITWEPEILVSNGIMLKIRGSFPAPDRDTTIYLVPAYYPSLVVRKDSSSTKAYIVFQGLVNDDRNHHCENNSCTFPDEDPCKDFLNPICEAILDVGGASLITPPTLVRAIHQIVYGDINNFGAPVINSSKESLYVSWADSLCGIGIGHKLPNSIGLTSTNFIKAIDGITSHPSLNIYSLSDKNENDCSLVWEEKSNPSALKSIYYTKIRMNGGSIENFLPAQISSRQNLEVFNNCLKVSDNHSSELPTVYRLLSYQGSSLERFIGFEVIAWNSISEKNISTRAIRHTFDENQSEPYFWSVLYPQRSIKSKSLVTGGQISNMTHNFSKPVLSQMNSYNLGSNGLPNPNNHNYLLNFVDNWNFNILQSSGTVIYHLNDIFSSLNDLSIQASDFSKTVYPVNKGNNVHLAYSPKLNNEAKNVWKNNRIYENTQSKIISNPIYFYPIDECPECIKSQLFIEFEKPNSGGGISNTKFTLANSPSFPLPINLPYQVVADSLGDYLEPIKKDTLFTDWFYIDSSATVEYLIKLNDTNHVNMKLQKLSDSSFVDLPAPFLAGSGFAQQVFHLVNGNNDEYRLAMINNDTLLNYVENLYFEAPYVSDTVYSKRNIEVKQNVINLNKNIQTNKLFSINCMPNPANEVLNIAVYSNQSTKVESVLIKIYNQQGILVNEYQSSINSTLSIPVTQLTNGVYMIKASITTPDGFYNESSKVMILK